MSKKIKQLTPNQMPITGSYNMDWGDVKIQPRGVGLDVESDLQITQQNEQLIQYLTSPEYQKQQTQELNRVLKTVVGRNLFNEDNTIDTTSQAFTEEEMGFMDSSQKPFAKIFNDLYENKGVVYEEDLASKMLNNSMTNGWVKMISGYSMGDSMPDLKLTNNGFTYEGKQLKLDGDESKVLSDYYETKKGINREKSFIEDVATIAGSLIVDLPLMYLTGGAVGAGMKAAGTIGKAGMVANSGWAGRLVNQAVQQSVQFNVMGIPQTAEAYQDSGAGGAINSVWHNSQMGVLGASTGSLGRLTSAKAIAKLLNDKPALAEEIGGVLGAFGFGAVSSKISGESYRDALASGLAMAGTHFTNPSAMNRVIAEQKRSGKAIYTEEWNGKGKPTNFSQSYFIEENGSLFQIDAHKVLSKGVIEKTSKVPLKLTDSYKRYNETENHVLITFGQALSNERLSRESKKLYDRWSKELEPEYVKANEDKLQILSLATAGQVIVGKTEKLFNKVSIPEDAVLNDKIIELSNNYEIPYSDVKKYIISNMPEYFANPDKLKSFIKGTYEPEGSRQFNELYDYTAGLLLKKVTNTINRAKIQYSAEKLIEFQSTLREEELPRQEAIKKPYEKMPALINIENAVVPNNILINKDGMPLESTKLAGLTEQERINANKPLWIYTGMGEGKEVPVAYDGRRVTIAGVELNERQTKEVIDNNNLLSKSEFNQADKKAVKDAKIKNEQSTPVVGSKITYKLGDKKVSAEITAVRNNSLYVVKNEKGEQTTVSLDNIIKVTNPKPPKATETPKEPIKTELKPEEVVPETVKPEEITVDNKEETVPVIKEPISEEVKVATEKVEVIDKVKEQINKELSDEKLPTEEKEKLAEIITQLETEQKELIEKHNIKKEEKVPAEEPKIVPQIENTNTEPQGEASVKKPIETIDKPTNEPPRASIKAEIEDKSYNIRTEAEGIVSSLESSKRNKLNYTETLKGINRAYKMAEDLAETLNKQQKDVKVKPIHIMNWLLHSHGLSDVQIEALLKASKKDFLSAKGLQSNRKNKVGTFLEENLVGKIKPRSLEVKDISANEVATTDLSIVNKIGSNTYESETDPIVKSAIEIMKGEGLDPFSKKDIEEASLAGLIEDTERKYLLKNLRTPKVTPNKSLRGLPVEDIRQINEMKKMVEKGQMKQEEFDRLLKEGYGIESLEDPAKIEYEKNKSEVKDILNRPGSFPSQLEALAPLTKMGLYHLERIVKSGVEKAGHFSEWAKDMIKEVGDKVIPYLTKIWNNIKAYSTGEKAFLNPNTLGMIGGELKKEKKTIIEVMKDTKPEAVEDQMEILAEMHDRWQARRKIPGEDNSTYDKFRSNKIVRKLYNIGDTLVKAAIQNRNWADQRDATTGKLKHEFGNRMYHHLEKGILDVKHDINTLLENKEGWNKGKEFDELRDGKERYTSKRGKYFNDVADGKREILERDVEKGETFEAFIERAGKELGMTTEEINVEKHYQTTAKQAYEKQKEGYGDFLFNSTQGMDGKETLAMGLSDKEIKKIFGDSIDNKLKGAELEKEANKILGKDEDLKNKVVDYLTDKLYPENNALYNNDVRPSDPKIWQIRGSKPLDVKGEIAKTPEEIAEWQTFLSYGENEKQAKQKADEHIKLGFSIDSIDRIGDIIKRGEYDKLTANQLMNLVNLGNIEANNPVIHSLMNAIKSGTYDQHRIKKRYIRGMHHTPKEFELGVTSLINEAVSSSTRRYNLSEARDMIASYQDFHNEQMKSTIKTNAEKDRMKNELEYSIQMYNQVSRSDKSFIDAWRQGATAYYIGMKPAFWFQQAMQPLQTTLPEAIAEVKGTILNGAEVWKNAFGTSIELSKVLNAKRKGEKYETSLSKEYLEMYEIMDAKEIMGSVGMEELTGGGRDTEMKYGSDLYKGWNKMLKIMNLGGAAVEKFTRFQAFSTFYEIGKAKNLSGKELETYIETKIQDVMSSWGAIDRPAVFQSKQLGKSEQKVLKAIDKAFFTFRTFSNANTGQYDRLYRNNNMGIAGLKLLVGTGMHGVTKVPFAATVFALIDLFTEDDSEYETLKLLDELNEKVGFRMGSIIGKGVPSAFGEINFQNLFDERSSFATDVYVQTRSKSVEGKLADAMFGAPYGLSKDILEGSTALAKVLQQQIREDVTIDEEEKRRAINTSRKLLPLSLRNILASMSLAKDGVEVKGKSLIKAEDISWSDVVYKALSFNPAKVSDAYEYQFNGTPAKLSRIKGKQIEIKRIRKEILQSEDYTPEEKRRQVKIANEKLKEAQVREAELTKQLKMEQRRNKK
jgi:hypothetical protein